MKTLMLVLLLALSAVVQAQIGTVVPPGMTRAQADAAIAAQSTERLLSEIALRRLNPAGAPCIGPSAITVGAIDCLLPYGVLVGKARGGTASITLWVDGILSFTKPLQPGGGFYVQLPTVLNDGVEHIVRGFADGTSFDADFKFTWAKVSPDGASIPPYVALTDNALKVWTVRAIDKVILIDGAPTNGHATVLKFLRGGMYAKSPTGGVWYLWKGNNTWQRLTTVEPI